MRPTVIYALRCPLTNAIRYIGKTCKVAKARLAQHIYYARSGRSGQFRSTRWIKGLLDRGLYPVLETLQEVPAGEPWQEHERRWISDALADGCELTNITPGGDGGPDYIFEDDRRRRREAIRAIHTPEMIARRNSSIKSAWADPTKRANIVSKQKAAAMSPERRAELSQAALQRTKEGEQRRRDAVALYWSDPANRAKAAERMRLVGKRNHQPKTII